MKRITTMAALLLLGAATPALAQRIRAPSQPAPPPPPAGQPAPAANAGPSARVSNEARPALIELQKAVQAKDVANIPAKLAAARAAARTKDDRYMLARLQLQAAADANDNALAAVAVDEIASSGLAAPADVVKLYTTLGGSYFNQKQYAQAAVQYQKALAITPNDTNLTVNLAEARYAQGQAAEAVAALQKVIAQRGSGGAKAEETLYKRALNMAYQAKLPVAAELARAWVTAYPSADSWRNAIAIYRNQSQPDVEGTLALLRLMQAANAMSTPADYAVLAEAAAEQSNYNEAEAVLDAGIKAGVVKPSDPKLGGLVMEVKAKRKSTPEDLEGARKMSPDPVHLLRIGDRYYAMGNYSKAIEVYREVMAKPGADKNIANLHLGMAMAKAGDKAGATAAFNAVTGPRAEIAKFWLLYLQQQG